VVAIYRIYSFSHLEQFCSELNEANLQILVNDIPECQVYLDLKK